MNETEIIPLLVVGAGPVGLSAALAAANRGARRVLIVDQSSAFKRVGQTLQVMPNAMRALELISPQARKAIQPFVVDDSDAALNVVQTAAPGDIRHEALEHTPEQIRSRLAWWQLQRLLIGCLPPSVSIVINHRLYDILQDPKSLYSTACFHVNSARENKFRNWEENPQEDDWTANLLSEAEYNRFFASTYESSGNNDDRDCDICNDATGKTVLCKAKVIIAADGISSMARKSIYRYTRPGWEKYSDALYTGHTRVSAEGSPTLTEEHESILKETFFRKGPIAMVHSAKDVGDGKAPHLFIGNFPANPHFTWFVFFFICVEETKVFSVSPKELRQIAYDQLRKYSFPEEIIELTEKLLEKVGQNDLCDRPLYVLPAMHPPPFEPLPTSTTPDYPEDFYRPWYYGRVVLVGDAAHGCPPYRGQGVAVGVEDVYELVVRLARRGLWSKAGSEENWDFDAFAEIFEEYYQARIGRASLYQSPFVDSKYGYNAVKVAAERHSLWNYEPTIRE